MKNEFAKKLLQLDAHLAIVCVSKQILSTSASVGLNAGNAIYWILQDIDTGLNGLIVCLPTVDLAVDDIKTVFQSNGNKDTVAESIWKTSWKYDAELSTAILPLLPRMNTVDPTSVMSKLCEVDLADMTHIARCFYLWSLYDLEESIIRAQYDTDVYYLIQKWNCSLILDGIPIDVTDALRPITGNMGRCGGQSALNRLIGEYAARAPTRVDVIERLST